VRRTEAEPVRRLAGRALLILGGTVLGLAGAELGLRALRPDWAPRTAERALFWRHDPTLGWAHRAGARGRFRGPGWDVEVRINARGLRDRERDARPAPGARRVLLLGDSMGWGFGVAQEEALGAVLEGRCPGLEVVNASVSGWSTDQELLWFEREGARLRPHEVLLLAHENDLAGNAHERMYGYAKPRFALEGGALVLRNVPVRERTALEALYTGATARSWLASGLLRRPALAMWLEFGEPFGATTLSVDGPVTRALLGRLAASVRRAGASLRVALVPMPPVFARVFQEAGRASGFPVLDLSSAFAAAGARGEALHLRTDPHWSAAGHRVAAEALAAELSCRLPPAPGPGGARPSGAEPGPPG
jgi:hypothetical protein